MVQLNKGVILDSPSQIGPWRPRSLDTKTADEPPRPDDPPELVLATSFKRKLDVVCLAVGLGSLSLPVLDLTRFLRNRKRIPGFSTACPITGRFGLALRGLAHVAMVAGAAIFIYRSVRKEPILKQREYTNYASLLETVRDLGKKVKKMPPEEAGLAREVFFENEIVRNGPLYLSQPNALRVILAFESPSLNEEDLEQLVDFTLATPDKLESSKQRLLAYYSEMGRQLDQSDPDLVARFEEMSLYLHIEGQILCSEIPKRLKMTQHCTEEIDTVQQALRNYDQKMHQLEATYIEIFRKAVAAEKRGEGTVYQDLMRQALQLSLQERRQTEAVTSTLGEKWGEHIDRLYQRSRYPLWELFDTQLYPVGGETRPNLFQIGWSLFTKSVPSIGEDFREELRRRISVTSNPRSDSYDTISFWNFHARVERVRRVLDPETLKIIMAKADFYDLDPILLAAIVSSEQYDQSYEERCTDRVAGGLGSNTSVGSAQVQIETVRQLYPEWASADDRQITSKLLEDDFNLDAATRFLVNIRDEFRRVYGREPTITELGTRYTSSSFFALNKWGELVNLHFLYVSMSGLFGPERRREGELMLLGLYDARIPAPANEQNVEAERPEEDRETEPTELVATLHKRRIAIGPRGLPETTDMRTNNFEGMTITMHEVPQFVFDIPLRNFIPQLTLSGKAGRVKISKNPR